MYSGTTGGAGSGSVGGVVVDALVGEVVPCTGEDVVDAREHAARANAITTPITARVDTST
jgi:hypothetical protein